MQLSALTCLITLLPPATAGLEPSRPIPSIQAADTATLDDEEILRQYSIYTGLQLAAEIQHAIRHHVSQYLADPETIRQSILDHLNKPMDSEQLDKESQRIYKLHKQALIAAEAERDKTFMQENAKRPGVVSLPIGIQYEVVPDPAGNNRQLEEMGCFIRSTTIGRQLDKETEVTAIKFSNTPSGPPDFSDKLPNILQHTSALDNLPKGGEYIFYVPDALLSSSERKYIGNENAVIVYTFRHTDTDDELRHLRHLPFQIDANGHRQKYSELQGADMARDILLNKQRNEDMDIDPALVQKTCCGHLDSPIDLASLQHEYRNVISRYKTIHIARQTERDKRFLKENAAKPGVVILGNGIQYTVEKNPAGRNVPIIQSELVKRTSIDGTQLYYSGKITQSFNSLGRIMPGTVFSPGKVTAEEYDMPGLLGTDIARVASGRKWIFYIPFERLSEQNRKDMKDAWDDDCPAYIVHTFEADDNQSLADKDEDIEDDATAKPDEKENFLWDKDRTAESMARDEALFLRLNAMTPNVTVLPNGIQYSCITDPDGNNGSIKQVGIMSPYTLAGDSFLSHIHLDHQNTRADGKRIYTHPLIEPYIDTLPEAKKWFFCIPASLLDPADVDCYEQRIGAPLNYVLYILETDKKH